MSRSVFGRVANLDIIEQQFRESLNKWVRIRHLPNSLGITTPMECGDGHAFHIRLRPRPSGDGWALTDDGHSIPRIHRAGQYIWGDDQNRAVDLIVQEYDGWREKDVLWMPVKSASSGWQLFRFCEMLTRVRVLGEDLELVPWEEWEGA